MYELEIVVIIIILAAIIGLIALMTNNEPAFYLALIMVVIAILLPIVEFHVPKDYIGATIGSDTQFEPGSYFMTPGTNVFYSLKEPEYKTVIKEYAADGIIVEFRVSYSYTFTDNTAYPQYMKKWGDKFMDKTYRELIVNYFRANTCKRDSRWWFHCDTLKEVQPDLVRIVGDAMKVNGMKITSNSIYVDVYLEESIYNRYGSEDVSRLLPGRILEGRALTGN